MIYRCDGRFCDICNIFFAKSYVNANKLSFLSQRMIRIVEITFGLQAIA